MSYLDFYGLKEEPFSNAPMSHYYFPSKQHAEALMRLTRITSGMKGLAVLVGDIGAGKTTLARKLLDSLPEEEYEAALLVIIHSEISPNWLLRRIAQQLGVQNPAQEKLQILSQLYRRLLQLADAGKKAVVIIDEAQMLQTRDLMEEFRGLLNLEIPGRKLITFVFLGLPEIEDNLMLDPPLAQRVAMKFRLDALDIESCAKYIKHRMLLAGASGEVFTNTGIEAIYEYSQGFPRLINTIGDNALFEGFMLKASKIDREIVDRIAVDLGLTPNRKRDLRVVRAAEGKPEFKTNPMFELAQEGEGFIDLKLDSEENTSENDAESKFERENADEAEDIDKILSGLEEKL